MPTFWLVSTVTAVVPAVAIVTVPPELLTVTLDVPLEIDEPLALTVAQVPSPRKYVVLDGVPVTMPTAVAELKRLLLDAVAPAGKVTAVLAVAVND